MNENVMNEKRIRNVVMITALVVRMLGRKPILIVIRNCFIVFP